MYHSVQFVHREPLRKVTNHLGYDGYLLREGIVCGINEKENSAFSSLAAADEKENSAFSSDLIPTILLGASKGKCQYRTQAT